MNDSDIKVGNIELSNMAPSSSTTIPNSATSPTETGTTTWFGAFFNKADHPYQTSGLAPKPRKVLHLL